MDQRVSELLNEVANGADYRLEFTVDGDRLTQLWADSKERWVNSSPMCSPPVPTAPRPASKHAPTTPAVRCCTPYRHMTDTIQIHPATADRWDDLSDLFGDNGIVAGCWCMYFRLTGREFHDQRGDPNRESLRALTSQQFPPGLLAYQNGTPVGWCAVAPRCEYGRIERSPTVRPIDDQPAWAITCLYTSPQHRHQGVADALIAAAIDFARTRGGSLIEGYPVTTTQPLPAGDAYTGTPAMFANRGFGHAITRGQRSIWRRHLQPERTRP